MAPEQYHEPRTTATAHMGETIALDRDSQPSDLPPREPAPEGGTAAGWLLVLAGLGFLLSNLGWLAQVWDALNGILSPPRWITPNWWALFLLIPVVVTGHAAARQASAAGGWNKTARATLIGGAFPLAVAVIFFFEWDWAVVWPIFPILAGLWMIAGAALPGRRG